MRVQLDTGSRSVELETSDTQYSWEVDERFMKMTLDALYVIGYTKKDIAKFIEENDDESN